MEVRRAESYECNSKEVQLQKVLPLFQTADGFVVKLYLLFGHSSFKNVIKFVS